MISFLDSQASLVITTTNTCSLISASSLLLLDSLKLAWRPRTDIGGNSNGRGHRQQSTIIGSKYTVAVATVIETAHAGTAMTAFGHTNDCPRCWHRRNHLRHRLGRLWVLVVKVVCGVVHAGCVCAARPCCFVRLTCISASNIWQTTAYWGLPERSQWDQPNYYI